MESKCGFSAIGFVVGVSLMTLVGCLITEVELSKERNKAVVAKAARYVVDPETGKTTFVYGLEAK